MARSHYKSNKRQKELAKKEKKEIKRQRKIDRKIEEEAGQAAENPDVAVDTPESEVQEAPGPLDAPDITAMP